MNKIPLMLILFSVILSACGSPATPEPTFTPQESAWGACTLFIQQQVGLSIFDAQRYSPSRVTTLEGNQFTVEVYYADPGDTYRCELLRRSDGNWELQGLEVR